jgi:branched-chain amino acid transport system substrate-binding protein
MAYTRRTVISLLASAAAATLVRRGTVRAEDGGITIAIDLPLTGSGADDATNVLRGAVLAIEEANAARGPGGHRVRIQTLDDSTATAGQYDPAQAAENARRMVADASVVGAIGPMNSGSGVAMAPILSRGNLAIISPHATSPDLTDPKFAALYRPAGLPIFFRTVTTDAFQGPHMANFVARDLKVKSIFVVDDSGVYGVRLVDAFAARAGKLGMSVLGRDRVDPAAPDYTALLNRIRDLDPQAIYCGASALAGTKLVMQSYDVLPNVVKAGGDGIHQSILGGAGFPAADGWYTTIAAPHLLADAAVFPWRDRYVKRWGAQPSDYAITSYDAAQVLLAAIASVAASGQPVTRAAVRDAVQAGRVQTLQGEIAFDANGDLRSRIVSVFQVRYDPAYPATDAIHQHKYLGVAPSDDS